MYAPGKWQGTPPNWRGNCRAQHPGQQTGSVRAAGRSISNALALKASSIVAHQGSQLGQALGAELVQRGLKCRLTDLMGMEKFHAIVDHRGFIGRQRR